MPRIVRPPKIKIGIRTRSNTLRSKIPRPTSNAVTTAQIVRTMKRGENGSINVSMGPFQAVRPSLLVALTRQPNPTGKTTLYTKSGGGVTGTTTDRHQRGESSGG